MVKSKKQMFTIISIFALILLLGTTTYAFFNYTRTGSPNNFSVGRISFISRNEQTVNLSNLFPIDPTELGIMNDSTKVGTYQIEIVGDTDYDNGLEYLVSIVDTDISTSTGKNLPISIDVTVNNLGTQEVNYFAEREDMDTTIFKKLIGGTIVGDQMALVGYIKPNSNNGTIEGVNGSITIKAYLDQNNIAISDTYDGTESDSMGTTNNWVSGRTVLTTSEWDALRSNGVSFKIKVEANEGIWVKEPLDNIVRVKNINLSTGNPIKDNEASEFVSESSGISFDAYSSDTNGKGVYMKAETANDDYPILYYRGDITDNNVLFGNQCWKMLRTTDTGGVKLIYNGTPKDIIQGVARDDYNVTLNTDNTFTYDEATTKWMGSSTISGSVSIEFEFSVPAGDNYVFDAEVKLANGTGGTLTILKNNTTVYTTSGGGVGTILRNTYNASTLTTDDVIKFTFVGVVGTGSIPITYTLQMYQTSGEVIGKSCDNQSLDAYLSSVENNTPVNTFNYNNASNSLAYVGYMYGTIYAYSSDNWTTGAKFGNSFTWDGTSYKLTDASVTTPDNSHHYSCNSTNENATCSNLRYVIYMYKTTIYYITLQNGKSIENALDEMRVNTTDSVAKNKIETWYSNNMNSFTNKLEDTIYCNDRSISNLGAWNPNGDSGSLTFGSLQRVYINHTPSVGCSNKNDSFTWRNGNGNKKLQHPVGLITADEILLAGGGNRGMNERYYLYTGENFWTMSPSQFNSTTANVFTQVNVGVLANNRVEDTAYSMGLRPVISIKPGTIVTGGNGTVNNPFAIE